MHRCTQMLLLSFRYTVRELATLRRPPLEKRFKRSKSPTLPGLGLLSFLPCTPLPHMRIQYGCHTDSVTTNYMQGRHKASVSRTVKTHAESSREERRMRLKVATTRALPIQVWTTEDLFQVLTAVRLVITCPPAVLRPSRQWKLKL